ncbi:shikimate kinase [Paenibacillus lignilyticus]|uniref:Shikimate kinase n=1 Tax=Paenibacillus lignilyticus TaxID=1172615 RepID=A0ABS5C5B5_9BACL|nr:shikimate kinase [Paenibacillus lignilyticus]MBP3961165.1 shikimate kinase [Paenibacillus lignilyticus]
MTKEKPLHHVVLIGFMGTGKSTVSKQLAELLKCGTADIDAEIVRREGQAIADIFAARGEADFRLAETAALAEVLGSSDPLVIATGGGAVLSERNRAMMLQDSFVVALTADPEQIIARVSEDAARPLLQGDVRERVYKLLEDRKHAYAFAHLTVDTSDLSVRQVVELIEHGIKMRF